MACEPGVGSQPESALLLVIHHFERVAEPLAPLLLHLAEDQPPAPANDDVELVAGGPGVRRQDSVPAQAVPPYGALLGAPAWAHRHNGRFRRGLGNVCTGFRTPSTGCSCFEPTPATVRPR